MFLDHTQKLLKTFPFAEVDGRKTNANSTPAFVQEGLHQSAVRRTTNFHQLHIAALAKELFHNFVGGIDVVLSSGLKNAFLIFRQETSSDFTLMSF